MRNTERSVNMKERIRILRKFMMKMRMIQSGRNRGRKY